MGKRLLKWIVCIFIVPLLPFLVDWFMLFMSDPKSNATRAFLLLPPFWERGELFILAIAIAATGFGDLSTSPSPEVGDSYPAWGVLLIKWMRFLALTSSVVIFCGSLLFYVAVSACLVHGKPYGVAFVTQWSPIIFIFSAIVGLACVVLSKET
jgi:hypothetical protein